MAEELRSEDNLRDRIVTAIRKESKSVTIAGISLVVSCLFAIIAVMAMHDANQANATAGTWQTMYKETERECRLAQMEIDDFRIILIRAGLDTEHIGEKP